MIKKKKKQQQQKVSSKGEEEEVVDEIDASTSSEDMRTTGSLDSNCKSSKCDETNNDSSNNNNDNESSGGRGCGGEPGSGTPTTSSSSPFSTTPTSTTSTTNTTTTTSASLINKKKFKDDKTGEWTCPVCDTVLDSQHSFTVHIRSHNPTDHSHTCSICGKTLSSASSLDRHMLIHSGERPFKCRICNMAFTTNGNMHRHMRTHGMELTESNHERTHAPDTSHDSNNNRLKSKKRKSEDYSKDSKSHNSPKNRRQSDGDASATGLNNGGGNGNNHASNGKEQFYPCYVCTKVFPTKPGLLVHMESHPNDPISCRDCGSLFENYSLYTEHHCPLTSSTNIFNGATTNTTNGNNHNKRTLMSGTPTTSSPQAGFFDLTFTDFSSTKFSLIAKSLCEHNARKTSSQYHDFECNKCERAFPCGSALNLHQSGHKAETYCQICRADLGTPALYLNHQLKHSAGAIPLNGVASKYSSSSSSQTTGIRDKSAFSEIPRCDKEGFLAMLQLQNRGSDSSMSPPLRFERNEDVFDNPSYYIHAKPVPPNHTAKKPITFSPKIVNGGGSSNDGTSEQQTHVCKHDLADIQSIISVTSTATPLITQIRSSPPVASPASPAQAGLGQQTEPESTVPADSPNPNSLTAAMPVLKDNVSDLEKKEEEAENEGGKAANEEENQETADENEIRSDANPESNLEVFKCTVCNLEFKSANSLKRHNRGHVQGGHSYACDICTYTSLDKSTLIRHFRTHNGERPFQCSICKYAFTTKANCERHVRKRHKKTGKHEIRSSMQYNADMAAAIAAGGGTSVCNGSTSNLTIQNLSKHNSLPLLADYPSGNETVCKYCNVDFKYNRVLRHHLRSLQNSCHRKPYTCSACKLGFSTKNNCVRHVVKQHPELKDKLSSVVSVNGSSTASNSPSDLSESESNTMDSLSQRWSQDGSLMSSSAYTQFENQQHQQSFIAAQQGHSSLAALCQIAGRVARLESEPMALDSESEEYDGDESNDNLDDQPLDLARNYSYRNEQDKPLSDDDNEERGEDRERGQTCGDQPLDLAVHALDLSLKSRKSLDTSTSGPHDLRNHSETVRNAASTLLALQSSSHLPMSRSDSFNTSASLLYPNLSKSPLQPHHSSSILSLATHSIPPTTLLVSQSQQSLSSSHVPSTATLPLPPPSHLPAPISSGPLPLATGNVENFYRLSSAFRITKSPVVAKNQRSFTCMFCSAGFTLKSNMERHIKRKHPEHARPPRSRGSSSKEGTTIITTPNGISSPTLPVATFSGGSSSNAGAVSLLSKPNGTTLSSKTRAALRVVLSNKGLGSNTGGNSIPAFPGAPSAAVEGSDSRASSPEPQHSETNQSFDDVGGDLASVSSLIADTANSSNALRQYFRKADESEPNKSDTEPFNASASEEFLTKAVHPDDNNVDQSSNENSEGGDKQSSLLSTSSSTGTGASILGSSKKRSAYTDSPNSVSCPYCARRFPWTSSLRRHVLTHTGLKPFKCPKCPILFTTKSNCERHLVRKHGGESGKRNLRSEIQTTFHQETRQYKCTSCVNTYFPNQGSLKKHFYLRHLTKSNNGPSLLKSRASHEKSEINHLNNINNSSDNTIVEHIPDDNTGTKLKTFDLLFKCHVCTAPFTDRTECLSHIESCHSVDYKTLLAKGEVDKVRTSETKMMLAIKSGEVATSSRKIYCIFCPRQFNTDDSLQRHMKVHLGERPYKCVLCTKRFSLKNSLLRHIRTNHPNDSRALKATKGKRRVKVLRLLDVHKTKEDNSGNILEPIPTRSKSPKELSANEDTNDGGDLIQNLLGIQDKNMLDEMLNSADSAARLLGVKEALKKDAEKDEEDDDFDENAVTEEDETM